MIRVLVVDDERILDPVKIAVFGGHTKGSIFVRHETTANNAEIRLRQAGAWAVHLDELWLDHDLGGHTIRDLVIALEEDDHFHRTEGRPRRLPMPDRVFVHSANPLAFDYIKAAFRHSDCTVERVDAADFIVEKK